MQATIKHNLEFSNWEFYLVSFCLEMGKLIRVVVATPMDDVSC